MRIVTSVELASNMLNGIYRDNEEVKHFLQYVENTQKLNEVHRWLVANEGAFTFYDPRVGKVYVSRVGNTWIVEYSNDVGTVLRVAYLKVSVFDDDIDVLRLFATLNEALMELYNYKKVFNTII